MFTNLHLNCPLIQYIVGYNKQAIETIVHSIKSSWNSIFLTEQRHKAASASNEEMIIV